ncbi:MAG: N-sulfoglucosamine sulfohydrolase [Akkermansiaceae bacterium]|jgi:N-sulfoglucosamine sulfohydrolase
MVKSLLLFFVCFSGPALAVAPNIVLIIADDMNWDDSGAYGHPSIETPHIDALAKSGLSFEHAYLTANSCSPSRASIITGRYPHNTGAEQLHWPLPAESLTFVEQLKGAGYYTAAAGKWHLGDAVKDRFDDVFEASTAGFILPTGPGQEPGKMVAKSPSGCEGWLSALQNRPKDKPFFLWLAALDPHRAYEDGALDPPHKVSQVRIPPYIPDTLEVREDFRLYYDEIGRLDQYVGKVVAELDRQGVSNNTLVLFISDNGRPFPGDKTTLYDGGIRTPWIVKWPATIEANQRTRSLVSSIDIAPTFIALAGLTPRKLFEGTSFFATLQDPTATTREYVFAEDHWHDYEDHGRAVATQDWKLIHNTYPDLPNTPSADAGRSPTWTAIQALARKGQLTPAQRRCLVTPRAEFELYDLKNDPFELKNLAAEQKHQEMLEDLKGVLKAQFLKTKDYLPSKRTPDEFNRITGAPDHSVRKRPRPSKKEMFKSNGRY